jgi:magnesium chelatase family protein
VGPGLPGLSIVGLVETAIKESRDRVKAALLNSGFKVPDRRIIVSLAPADLPKSGSRYDLPIAIGILCASRQVPDTLLNSCEFNGELALSGRLRTVPGLLPVAMQAAAEGHRLIIPGASAAEVALLDNPGVLLADDLAAVAAYLRGESTLTAAPVQSAPAPRAFPDLADVVGQQAARRALEIAASGGHHLLMSGPPGTGKSMLAQRLPGILPEPGVGQALETAAIYSLKGIAAKYWPDRRQPPYRAPHHTASAAALAGGGSHPSPGEISLAHNGVLFLDELPEFKRGVLEVLREPLESGTISISRASRTASFPARTQLVAAMNPCPCGYLGDSQLECRCTPDQIRRYAERLSGPLLDRIDLSITVARQPPAIFDLPVGECSAVVRSRVCNVRTIGKQRSGKANASLQSEDLRQHCRPDAAGRELLNEAATRLGLSHRACDRSLRVARTIADMDSSARILKTHIAEALVYLPRSLQTGQH